MPIASDASQGDLFDSNTYSLGSKIGFRVDGNQRIELAANRECIRGLELTADHGSTACRRCSLRGLRQERQPPAGRGCDTDGELYA